MTDPTTESRTSGLTDREWWDDAVGRSVRTVWHFVGFYAAVVSPVDRLAAVLVVGTTRDVGPVSLPVAVTVLLAAGLAVLLSALRPTVSSARTLAFGFAAALLFNLGEALFGRVPLAGRPLVAVDVALAAVGALSLAALLVYGFDPSVLTAGVSDRD